jgi:malonyl CoA-acyl carrier protein transacylase
VTFTIDSPSPAVLFPGQGSQTPEMRDLVAATPGLLEACVELVGEDPFARVEESTRFAQPAIFCASMAAWSRLDVAPRAGALRLVVIRGGLMSGADDSGSMLALVGGETSDAAEIAEAVDVTVANDNAPGQVVLSGHRHRLAQAEDAARERGIRALPLDVAGAFHSPAMAPAVEPFRAALDEVELGAPRFEVFSCATAAPFQDVRDELAAALVRPVRWRETVLALGEAGAASYVDVGPGKVLARLMKRIAPGLKAQSPNFEEAAGV